jgi:xanthine/uracil permease
MIHLLWTLLNASLIIFFFYLIFGFIVKGKKIFNPRIKVVSILIITLGIIQIISASKTSKNSNQITITTDYKKTNNSKIKKIVLEDNLVFDINLLVKYSVENNKYIPIESNSFLTGLISGYDWEFKSFETQIYKPNEKANFTANGVLKWNIFGINVYSEHKTFSGKIE